MSNTKYTDPTNAEDPPGGKHHSTTPKKDVDPDNLPTEDGKSDDAVRRKTATSPKTVSKTEK
jgi:hypothetical protein